MRKNIYPNKPIRQKRKFYAYKCSLCNEIICNKILLRSHFVDEHYSELYKIVEVNWMYEAIVIPIIKCKNINCNNIVETPYNDLCLDCKNILSSKKHIDKKPTTQLRFNL